MLHQVFFVDFKNKRLLKQEVLTNSGSVMFSQSYTKEGHEMHSSSDLHDEPEYEGLDNVIDARELFLNGKAKRRHTESREIPCDEDLYIANCDVSCLNDVFASCAATNLVSHAVTRLKRTVEAENLIVRGGSTLSNNDLFELLAQIEEARDDLSMLLNCVRLANGIKEKESFAIRTR